MTSPDLAVPRPGEPDGVLHLPGGGVVQVGLAGGAAVVRRGAAAAAAAAARPPARVLPLPRAVPVSALLRQEGRPQPAPGEAAHCRTRLHPASTLQDPGPGYSQVRGPELPREREVRQLAQYDGGRPAPAPATVEAEYEVPRIYSAPAINLKSAKKKSNFSNVDLEERIRKASGVGRQQQI